MAALNTTPSRFASPRTLPLLVAVSYFLYLVRFGYGYGTSDQDEFLPLVMHKLDPSLFTTDWFVGTQTAAFSVRTYFSWLVEATATFLPLPAAIVVLYLLTWAGLALGVHRIALHLTRDRFAAGLAIPMVLVATPFWTLGGNDLAHSMLVPSMTAWALGLWGWGEVLRRNPVRAALWIGIATWMQALVGLHLALLAGLLMLWDVRQTGLKPVIRLAGTYALVAAPALIPLFYQQFTASTGGDADLFYIMARFRNPHHYLFHSFAERSYLRFGVVLVSGVITWKYLAWKDPAAHGIRDATRQTMRLVVLVAGLGGLAYVATEHLALLPVAKLQLFMPTVLAKTLLLTGIAAVMSRMIPAGIVTTWLEQHGIRLGLAGLVLGIMIWLGTGRAAATVYPWSNRTAPELALAGWIREHTPAEAVFAVPPSASFFRTASLRAIVVNHKAFPYRDADIVAWFERLNDLAPLPLPERADATLLGRLDAAYEALTPAELEILGERYGATFVVRQTRLEGRIPAFEALPWRVYRVERSR